MSRFSHRAEVLYSNRSKVLGLFADILDYPVPGLERKADECAALVGAVQPQAAALLKSFRNFTEETSVGKLQEVYSGFFDLNSICHPYVGYQLFGENYKRSIFLVELKKSYRASGFESDASEIPDRLSIVLRFAAQSDGEEIDALLNKGLLPALERMTTKPETESHQHGAADIDGDTGIERAKLDDRELRKQQKDQQREARKALEGQSQGDDRQQLKGQNQGDVLEAGFLLAMSEDYDLQEAEKRTHPYHQVLDALRLLLHEGMTKKRADRTAEQERVLSWTRERFNLDEDETIMVSELPCSDPGCPPVETHVVFWTQAGRQHFKVFKPLAEVAADDLLDWRA
ncbi:respiratory nitrate reductase chaperone NarJ [Nitrobacter hamburgensis X14]|uniref:Respiratory nitrate reductase chaperone NarJ n=1 Tax=Nitrobacter hamburgensis (strain DSM 10229 / NCIMB 13809 / X14) TaxID=323097 RepID=Q1QHX2_NITHX|nr:nitrate reductase molybdenum cofactor assembly chaperone [Nitrobacter hamburgensis]ABE64175.1 respiratory nitrate reductase chaperone NarJ [Nitrobacter hamburgensis X14]